MSNNKNVDQLKDKVADLGTEIKHKAQEVKLEGEKVLGDLQHSAKEAKLEGEKQIHHIQKELHDAQTDNAASTSNADSLLSKEKLAEVKATAQEKLDHFKVEAGHKLDEAKVKATELKHDASVKLEELKVQATDKFEELKKKANETLSKFTKGEPTQTDNQSDQESNNTVVEKGENLENVEKKV